jgi:hypothetical protein
MDEGNPVRGIVNALFLSFIIYVILWWVWICMSQ